MNRIEQLIEELCPEGVEWKELGEVCEFLNGKGHEKNIVDNGRYIVVNSKFVSTNGNVKKYSDQQISPIFINDILMVMSDLPNGKALAKCFIVDEDDKYTLNQRICALTVKNKNELDAKFLYNVINRNQELLKFDNKVDQTNLRKDDILTISIPIPPLPIQQEIVTILDTFTALDGSLQAELEARRKQYEHYRNQLLNFEGKEVEWKTLGEVCSLEYGKPLKETERNGGEFPVLGSNGIVGYHDDYLIKSPCIIVGRKGSAGAVNWIDKDCYPIDTTFYIQLKYNEISLRFLFYLLTDISLTPEIKGGGVPGLNRNDAYLKKIPIPPLSEQERIVGILDKFDALVNTELPAEIAARRKQYEYYREKLLTFEPLAN